MSDWTSKTPSQILNSLSPVSSLECAIKTLSNRGLNADSLPTTVLGIMPSARTLRRFGFPNWQANRSARKMVSMHYDADGNPMACRGRRTDGKLTTISGGRKTKSVAIGASSDTVMCTPGGLSLLKGKISPSLVIIGEGEGDLWVWAMLEPDIAYLASVSGSSCEAIAAKIPDGAKVVLRHHLDEAGEKMATKWGRLLEGRCDLWRLTGKEGGPDDGEQFLKGTLNTSNPISDCRRYSPAPEFDHLKDYKAQREAILSGQTRFPSAHTEIRMVSRYKGFIASVLNGLSGTGKGGRANAIYRAAFTIAGVCADAESKLTAYEASSIYQESLSLLHFEASSIMSNREQREARDQVNSGWKQGTRVPLELEDNFISPADLNRSLRKKRSTRQLSKKKAASNAASAEPKEEVIDELDGGTLQEVRRELDATVKSAVDGTGISIIIGPCGSGKTHATRKHAVNRLKDHRGDRKAIISLPTKDLGREMAQGFRAEAERQGTDLNIDEAVTRTPSNCTKFDIVKVANSSLPGGGSEFCRTKCPLGWGQWKSEDGSETPCPWARENKSSEDTDVLVNTHALEMKREALSEDEDALLRIDWPSFEHIADQGINAEPIVVRSESFSIRATASTNGGSPVPRAELVRKSSLTTQSKRDILTWLLSYYKIEIEEGKESDDKFLREAVNNVARDLTGTNEETKVFVRWTAIAEVSATGGMYPLAVPTVEFYKDGWLSGVHVSIRLLEDGETFPEIEVNHRMTRSDNSRQDVIDWISKTWDCPSDREALKEAAISRVTIHPIDLTVFDESLWGQALKGAEGTPEQFGKCISSGEVAGEGISTLLRLMGSCFEKKHEMYSDEIAQRISADQITVDPGRTGRQALDAIKAGQTKEQMLAHLDGLIPWVVPEGLHRALQNKWKGIMITKTGNLAVAWIKPIETRHSRSTVCLDATATPEIAKACFGGRDVNITEIKLRRPDCMNVGWIVLPTGTSASCFSGNSRIAVARSVAIQMEYGGEESLLVSHKKHVEDGNFTFDLASEDGTSLLHHNGTLARGSNKFENLNTAMLHDYHAPRGVIHIQAEALALAREADTSDKDVMARLKAEVKHQLEVAPVRQAAQRIRANLATEENPKTLLFISDTSPHRLGFYPDEVIDPGHLVYKHLGLSTVTSAAMVVSNLMDQLNGRGYMPTVALTIPGDLKMGDLVSDEVKTRVPNLVKSLGEDLIKDIYAEWKTTASQKIAAWVKGHFNGSWSAFAKECNINLAMIETSHGGQPSPYLYSGDFDVNDVAAWMTARRVAWWKVSGTDKIHVIEDALGVMNAIARLTLSQVKACSIGDLLALISHRLGLKTGRATRSRIGKYQLQGESLRECLSRLWVAVNMAANKIDADRRKIAKDQDITEAIEAVEASDRPTPMPWLIDEIAAAINPDESEPEWSLQKRAESLASERT